MGKSKKGRRGGGGDEEDWDSASESTQASFLAGDGNGVELERHDEFAEALDMTFESRGSTRERGWERLAALLRNSVREEVRRAPHCAARRRRRRRRRRVRPPLLFGGGSGRRRAGGFRASWAKG